MRAFLKSRRRWLTIGWFWPLVLLALPSCAGMIGIRDWNANGDPAPTELDPGNLPRTTGIMCDIPKGPPTCAMTLAEAADGTPLTEAAIALATTKGNNFGVDFSPDPQNMCGDGVPRKTEFYGKFPDGYPVCLNCNEKLHTKYEDGNEVCVAQCKDLFKLGDVPEPPGGVDAFCQANAKVSTNFDKNSCFPDRCSPGGTPLDPFDDQRRHPEDAKWAEENWIGTEVLAGNTLRRSAPTTEPVADFDAGAASGQDQAILGGDGWVEFGAGEPGVSHVLGLSSLIQCYPLCVDTTPGLLDMAVSLSLNFDGFVYLVEDGNLNTTNAPNPNGSWDTYDATTRFRIHFKDNFDGTAAISYKKVVGLCLDGEDCVEELITDHAGPGPKYPLGVNASFRETGATLVKVTLVYIKTIK